ncbi:MAG: hypothetical protein L6Q99_12420 [Planctomycetes bacterium]|nr:hypothetical protein [Planctomycetota bacterium]
MKSFRRSMLTATATTLVVSVLAIGTASAYSNYLNNWRTVNPTSTTDDNVINGTGQSCALCHFTTNGGKNWNAYGWKMRQNMAAGQSVNNAIINAGPFDSDADPTASTNITEIGANTQPGWTTGPHNTEYFDNGNTTPNLNPPATILGSLDPACSGSIVTYCTSKVNSLGCTPAISMTGAPSASAGTGCTLSTVNAIGNKNGLFFHSTSGPLGAPFHGGFLCVKAPTKRHAVLASGGTGGTCSGTFTEDFNAYIASGADPALVSGAQVWIQNWSRDPGSASTDSLSDAVTAVLCP